MRNRTDLIWVLTGTRFGRHDTCYALNSSVEILGWPQTVFVGSSLNDGVETMVGVDEQVYKWCVSTKTNVIRFPANWDTEGDVAGPNRNIRMCDAAKVNGKYTLQLGLPSFTRPSRGTRHCLRYGEKIGLYSVEVLAGWEGRVQALADHCKQLSLEQRWA